MKFLVFGLLFLTAVYVSESRTLVNTYDETVKDDLKNQIDNLKTQAQGAIQKLLAQGKTVLAENIKKLETHLVDLEAQLEKLNPQTEVGKALLKGLEALVKGAEGKLEEEIKKLAGSFYAEPTKDELKDSIEKVKAEAKKAIEKLEAQGKTALAGGIKNLETHLVNLEAELEKLNPQTEVGKALLKSLEALVKGAETRLEEEIKKLTGTFYAETTKDDLKGSIDTLKEQAKSAIEKLMGQGKTALAEGIKRVENQLLDLEAQLEKLNPQTAVGKALLQGLETLVKRAEAKLEEEIKKLTGTFYDETTKDELKNQVDNLKKQAQDAIQKLMAQGKTALAEGIKKLEAHLVDLEAQLEKLNPQTEVGKALLKGLEALVKGAEGRLEEEIKKLAGSYFVDDAVKTALLKQVSDLYDEVKAGIETLMKSGKTELVTGLEKVIQFVKAIDMKIKALKPTTTLGHELVKLVEKFVAEGEAILQRDLKKAQGMFYAEDENKAELLKIVGQVLDEAKAAYEKLSKENKSVVINALEKTVALAKEIETEMKSLHPTTTIGKTILTGIGKFVKQIEGVLEMDLKALKG